MRDARDELWRLMTGFQVSRAIQACAVLGVADHVAERPLTADDLARRTRTDATSLNRVLRLLAAVGVLHETEDGRFSLTDVGAYLRDGVPGSHAAMARLFAADSCWSAWGQLLHSVRTGETAFEHMHKVDVWRYRAAHPAVSAEFDEAMAVSGERFGDDLVAAYDFARHRKIVDVGGGNGGFLTRVLRTAPRSSGVVFDQFHVVRDAGERIAAAGLANRCEIVGGDFFDSVPGGGDAYVLKWILHDWDDSHCVRLLQVCRRNMRPSARLLILEHVIGAANSAADGKLLDLTMMVMTGGRERTVAEFAVLLDRANFEVVSIMPTRSLLSIIEAAPRM